MAIADHKSASTSAPSGVWFAQGPVFDSPQSNQITLVAGQFVHFETHLDPATLKKGETNHRLRLNKS